MAKKCNIVMNNSAVTVVEYGDNLIQFPAIDKKANTVLVEFDGENYLIIEEEKNAKKKSV